MSELLLELPKDGEVTASITTTEPEVAVDGLRIITMGDCPSADLCEKGCRGSCLDDDGGPNFPKPIN